ncbi:MAG TPA: FtsX-like permease family protein [Phnomibacter sp.]|nr:FtsX-like permease family protein [Phnomibacter sp.]
MTSLFAWRYFRSKKSANAINIISWISVAAVAVVTAALIVVLSVFNGFEDLVQQLYSDFYSDIRITSASSKWMDANAGYLQKVKGVSGVRSAEPVVEERAILLQEEDKSIVWLKGVSNTYASYSGVPNHIVRGTYQLGNAEHPSLVLGNGVENALQIVAGQTMGPVTIYLPNRGVAIDADPLTAMHSANAFAAGSFAIQQEFDNQYAFTDLAFMQYMLDLKPGQSSAVELSLAPGADADAVASSLRKKLGQGFEVKTRYQQNQSLFAAMQVEKLIIFGVAFLILLIAAFNIISSLSVTVLEKERDITVLQAMGAHTTSIARIYLKLGCILAGVGGIIGFVLGVAICLGQQHFHWVKLGGQSFIIDYFPVAMRWQDFLYILLLLFIISVFAGWLPARRASRVMLSLR